jgi:PP-loop superfamily ATP-utilizing enzyme
MMEGKTIAVWFSCGAASAMAAIKTIELYGEKNNVLIFNTPVLEEHEDNERFLLDVEKHIGKSIIRAVNTSITHNSAHQIWKDRKYMSGVMGAPCTKILKKEARYQIEKQYSIDYHVLGFTVDEISRHERFIKFERSNVLPILIDLKLTKTMCFDYLTEVGIELPYIYKHLANANCIGCCKATSATYWNVIRKEFPQVFKERMELSEELNVKLVKYKNKRIKLSELPEKARGGKINTYECGIFCDTK